MDEIIEIWNENGVPTGKTATKSEIHRNGWFHPTVHIWFYTADGLILLQKRAAEKETFPDLWDVSVAGHVQAGETPMEAALREVHEEIGLHLSSDELEFLDRFKSENVHGEDLIDREFHYCYLSPLKSPLESLRPEQGEVSALQLIPLLKFAEEAWGLGRPGKYVPHDRKYYARVVREIKSRL